MGTNVLVAGTGTVAPPFSPFSIVWESPAFPIGIPITLTLLGTAGVGGALSIAAHSAQLSVQELPN
jgi:hypothetical protein